MVLVSCYVIVRVSEELPVLLFNCYGVLSALMWR